MRSYLQILGVGEGRAKAPTDAPRVVPVPSTPRPRGRHVTDHERAARRRLPDPVPVARLDGSVPPEARAEYEMAMAGSPEAPQGAPFSGEPPMSIRSAARPTMQLSAFTPRSGRAENPQTGETI